MSEALWQNRIVELRMAKPADLRANPANFRKHPKAQRAALDGLLSEVGVVAPLMLNLRSEEQGWPEDAKETLIDGHLRHDLAESSEQAEVPVVVVDLSEDEENLVLATLDSSGAMAEKDSERLKALLGVVKPKNEGVAEMLRGLAERELGEYNADPTDAPTLPGGNRDPYQQMTFTLHDDQVGIVKEALTAAKANGGRDSDLNQNSNGNALAFVAQAYLDGQG